MSTCYCTMAIHGPYRQRARLLIADAPGRPWVVLTDEPDDFADLPVRTVRHAPTGPMAADLVAAGQPATGQGHGAGAYHDKRFALIAALEEHGTAVFVDADARFTAPPPLEIVAAGFAAMPVVRHSMAHHLEKAGSWRLPFFRDLAEHLTGDTTILHSAPWVHEVVMAVTKDGRESDFFAAWGRGADFMHARNMHSGEGGVVGLAVTCAGWTVDYVALAGIEPLLQHEGGGPKSASPRKST